MENLTSEQQLKQLLDEGKINESEYKELIDAMTATSKQNQEVTSASEPELRALRKRVLTGGMIIAAFGLPLGLILNLPYVWIMSILGIIVSGIKLRRIKDSWLTKLLNKHN